MTFTRGQSSRLVAAGLSVAAAGCSGPDSPRSPADDAQVDGAAVNADPLPSWNEGAAKRAIVEFVERVTEPGGPDYVAPEDRVATFDNDGTLWAEKPTYFQVVFLSDRVSELAAEHPEWRSTQPYKAVLDGDADYLHAIGVGEVFELFTATHAGMSQTEFEAEAREFLETARHPRFDVPFPELIYQPMLELLDHLRANFGDWQSVARANGRHTAMLDLRKLVRRQAELQGVRSERIRTVPVCTMCHPELFYSYRRDGAVNGTMLSGIMLTHG